VLLRETALLFQQTRAVAHDHAMQTNGLADEIGDHLEEAKVVVNMHRAPVHPGPIDR
jgi:hypothetical protein